MSDTNTIDATDTSSVSTEGATGSPSPETDVASTSSTETQTDVTAESSPEIADPKQFSDTIARLEEGKGPGAAVKEVREATEAKKDETAKEAPKESEALSQLTPEQEAALNKNFAERPEWKAILAATPKEKQKEVRHAMRGLYERETALFQQVEKQKPVLQTFERFRKGVGDDQAVENTIRLVELYQQGDPKALEMLDILKNDLLQRTGQVLTSPDLVQRGKAIDEALTQGTIDEAEAKQRKQDLLEVEKARIGKRQTESELENRKKSEEISSFENSRKATFDASKQWEEKKLSSDPDYPSLRDLTEARVAVLRDQHPVYQSGNIIPPLEAVKILDQAYEWAKTKAASLQPKPKPRTVLNGNGSSATSRRQPTNPEEAFYQKIEELEGRRR